MPAAIAAQLYTLRNFTKTPADIARTLQELFHSLRQTPNHRSSLLVPNKLLSNP